jgi:parvulin-like peptidyl-prolyl isomerase
MVLTLRTQTSIRRAHPRALLAALAAALLLLTACGEAVGDPQAAAVVNGEEILLDAVARRFEAVRRDPQLAQQLAADEDGSFKARVQARILTQMIQAELLAQAARDLGIVVTDEDIETERLAIVQQVGGEEAFQQIVEENRLTEEDVREQLRDLVVERAVDEALTEDIDVTERDVREFFEENQETRFESVRASHILVATEQEAKAVLERLEAGEDFAELARELSQDPGSAPQGGDLGEFTRGRLVPEFEEAAFGAEVGEVVGPIQTDFGFHVIAVTGRSEQSFADVRDEIEAELLEQRRAEARTTFREERFGDADINVNPRIGRWNEELAEVEAGDALGELEPVVDEDALPLELTPQQ